MFKVIDVFKIGTNLSVTFDGTCDMIKNGSKLRDENGNVCEVISIAMMNYKNPEDIAKSTTVLLSGCEIEKGNILYIA